MMRTISLSIIVFMLFSSCQKVIPVKLDASEVQYVIVGTVNDLGDGAQVSITQTKAFNENNQFPPVTTAEVSVNDNGIAYTLTAGSDGVYRNSQVSGVSGHIYQLTVLLDGQTYTASSVMPFRVPMDSIYIGTEPLNDKRRVTVVYKDPPGVSNYYKFVQYVNGNQEKSIFASDDEFTDGQRVRNDLNYNNDTDQAERDINKGDQVMIDMICTDAAVYKYWYSLASGATGSNQSASPANPVSNIRGGAVMGYFSAQTIERVTLTAN